MSYEVAAPPLGGSDGAVHERVNELVWILDDWRLVIALGACVSGAGRVVKVLSSELPKFPAASRDFTL